MNSASHRYSALLKAAFAVTVWGASFIATKLALREVSPVVVIWLRFGIGVVILGGFIVHRKELAFPPRRELGYFALLGFLGITFHQWLQVTGLVTAKATTTAWIITTIPIFIALLGRFMLKERLGWDRIAGIFTASIGVILVVSHGDLRSILLGTLGTFGDSLVLISAVNWAVFSVLSRKALQEHPATQMMFFVMLFGWIFTSVWFLAFHHAGEITNISITGWTSLLFLGIVCSGFAYVFWYDALKALSASRVGSFLYIEPLVAVIVAALVLEEPLFVAAFAGGALILAGVWLVNRRTAPEVPPE
ncbi:MAG: DMT family transporter [Ignavibacteriales bacterium]|nr:DMT family transporter [Ignavibacteriales bacterium]